jgi:hypothetical protein
MLLLNMLLVEELMDMLLISMLLNTISLSFTIFFFGLIFLNTHFNKYASAIFKFFLNY